MKFSFLQIVFLIVLIFFLIVAGYWIYTGKSGCISGFGQSSAYKDFGGKGRLCVNK